MMSMYVAILPIDARHASKTTDYMDRMQATRRPFRRIHKPVTSVNEMGTDNEYFSAVSSAVEKLVFMVRRYIIYSFTLGDNRTVDLAYTAADNKILSASSK